jgi:hypothetical protein
VAALTLLLLLMVFGAGTALAADDSKATEYARDNHSEGFSSFYPHHCWQGFDMIYHKEQVWQAFFKGGVGTKDEYDEIAVFISKNPVASAPSEKPIHYTVPDLGQTWSGDLTERRHSAVRFAVFKNRLFVYMARTYDHNTGMVLWEKELDDSTFDSKTNSWRLEGQNLWQDRPKDADDPRVLQGLVVKVINDTIYILGQQSRTKELWLMTSTDAVTYTRQKIHTFTDNDCLLNGDVIARGKDGAPLIAFVTKDDVMGGDKSTGTSKLWTFDPATKAVAQVAELPNKYKDVALVAGDVEGCTPYGTNNLQLWGIGWGSENVYHMQYVLNDEGTGGSFNPTGIVDHGNTSPHVEKKYRGYLAACAAPEPVAEVTPAGTLESLQMTARVWWWGSTDVSNAHGRSLKYTGDYLRNIGAQENPTAATEINDAWILQGVVMGVPPYYPNATEVGFLGGNCRFWYGMKDTKEVESTVTSEKTFSMSYKATGFFMIPSSSAGFGYSNAVEDTTSNKKTTTITTTLKFDPDSFPDLLPGEIGIHPGSQAWGVFLAPTITHDRYELYAPNKTTSLDVTLYYTYVSAHKASLISKVFDMTDLNNPAMSKSDRAYWAGIKTYPNSKEYYDPRWSDAAATGIASGSPYYDKKFEPVVNVEHNSDTFEMTTEDTVVESQKATNALSITGGAFGFESEMKGTLTLSSSTATTFGQQVKLDYGIFGWQASQVNPVPDDYGYYLTKMNLTMYLLTAKSKDAFWVPEGAKTKTANSYPWCVAWHVNSYHNKAMDLIGDTRVEVTNSQVEVKLRTALLAKLDAAKAAYDRGNYTAARNNLKALRLQIEAQAGKAIPQDKAVRWMKLIDLTLASDIWGR